MLSSGRKIIGAGRGVLRCRRITIAAMAALLLLPIEAGHAGWLSDMFKGSSKSDKASKRAAAPTPATIST